MIAQQWKKGREKTTFPNVFAYEYNRQKFANLERCDERASIGPRLSSSSKVPKRPIPVALPVLPPRRTEPQPALAPSDATANANGIVAHEVETTLLVERQRAEPEVVELSDSDDDDDIVDPAPTHPIITVTGVACDEPDASPSISNAITVTEALTNDTATNSSGDEPAICADSPLTCNDATVSDKSQMSFDEVLQIDESMRCDEDDDGSDIEPNALNESIIVEIHDVPAIELKIHESDSDESAFGTMKATKEAAVAAAAVGAGLPSAVDTDRERSYSEDDARDLSDEDGARPDERAVQSDSEILTKTPIERVVTCDINENVVLDNGRAVAVVDLDHNHNDILKCVDSDGETVYSDAETVHSADMDRVDDVRSMGSSEVCRVSISSSCDESDGEPMYATVDIAANMVSICRASEKERFTRATKRIHSVRCEGEISAQFVMLWSISVTIRV